MGDQVEPGRALPPAEPGRVRRLARNRDGLGSEGEPLVMPDFQSRETPDGTVITLDSPVPLNDFRSSTFREELYDLIQSLDDPRVVVDLAAIDYLSSSGVAILVGLKRRIDHKQGKLVLCRVQPLVCDLLRVMRLNQYFTFANTEDEGRALMRPVASA
jgi:anti-sigma B factor antagonist